jgi:hypothetical protein
MAATKAAEAVRHLMAQVQDRHDRATISAQLEELDDLLSPAVRAATSLAKRRLIYLSRSRSGSTSRKRFLRLRLRARAALTRFFSPGFK